MIEQGAEGRGFRWQSRFGTKALRCRHAPGHQPDRGTFHIALATGDLSGKAQAWHGLEAQGLVQQFRAVDKGIAVNAAEPGKLRILQPRDHLEDFLLGTVFQLGLEPDHIIQRAELVILTQLYHRMGFHIAVRVGEANWLHRPKAQCFDAAFGHDLDRQATLEIGRILFPFLEFSFRSFEQGIDEARILLFIHGAVDIVLAGAAGTGFVIAGLIPRLVEIDAVGVDDRCNGIKKRQLILAGQAADGSGEIGRGQGAGSDDHTIPVLGWQTGNLAPFNGDIRMVFQCLADII